MKWKSNISFEIILPSFCGNTSFRISALAHFLLLSVPKAQSFACQHASATCPLPFQGTLCSLLQNWLSEHVNSLLSKISSHHARHLIGLADEDPVPFHLLPTESTLVAEAVKSLLRQLQKLLPSSWKIRTWSFSTHTFHWRVSAKTLWSEFSCSRTLLIHKSVVQFVKAHLICQS
jgi:hypothetical protein